MWAFKKAQQPTVLNIESDNSDFGLHDEIEKQSQYLYPHRSPQVTPSLM